MEKSSAQNTVLSGAIKNGNGAQSEDNDAP
jgi:hypothetical protein